MLLGQPFTILSYALLPVLRCNCETGGTVQLFVQFQHGAWQRSAGVCPACGRTFSVSAIRESADKNALEIGIELGMAPPVDA